MMVFYRALKRYRPHFYINRVAQEVPDRVYQSATCNRHADELYVRED